jgi:hypothetical protein
MTQSCNHQLIPNHRETSTHANEKHEVVPGVTAQ